MSNSFKIANADTDSITVYKEDQSFFSIEERINLLKDLNSKCPDGLVWEDDGFFKCVIVLKAKNYILWDGNKIKYKGSALKSSTLEPKLKEFIKKIIDSILNEKNDFVDIYNDYVKQVCNISDITPWCTKKTLTEKTYNSTRKNETKILDAVEGMEVVEGDKVYLFYKNDESLSVSSNFNGDYNVDKYLEKLFKSTKRFETVLDVKNLFLNYSLKKNKLKLEELLKG